MSVTVPSSKEQESFELMVPAPAPLLDADDLRTGLGGGSRGRRSGQAGTDDEHVALEGLDDLVVSHGLGRSHERGGLGGVAKVGAVGHGGVSGDRTAGGLLLLLRKGGGRACDGEGGGADGGSCKDVAAGHLKCHGALLC